MVPMMCFSSCLFLQLHACKVAKSIPTCSAFYILWTEQSDSRIYHPKLDIKIWPSVHSQHLNRVEEQILESLAWKSVRLQGFISVKTNGGLLLGSMRSLSPHSDQPN